jgi:hypothetical protein
LPSISKCHSSGFFTRRNQEKPDYTINRSSKWTQSVQQMIVLIGAYLLKLAPGKVLAGLIGN